MENRAGLKSARIVTRSQVSEALDKSRVLNAATRRHWRSLLPHLGHDDLVDLWDILVDADRELGALDELAASGGGNQPADGSS